MCKQYGSVDEMFRSFAYEGLFEHFNEEWLKAQTTNDKITVWKKYADEFDKFMLLMGDPTAAKPQGLMKYKKLKGDDDNERTL